MHYLFSVYFVSQPLHVSGMLVAHHQEVYCVYIRKDKIRNNIIKQKMNVTRSLLEDIKTKQLKWYRHVQRMEEGDCQKKL